MSLTAQWEGGSEPLATNSGWSAFGKWAESLGPKYGRIKQLWDKGITSTAEFLSVELEHALTHSSPKEPSVHDTAENLLRIAESAGGAEYVAVTNGMGAEAGDDEVDEEAEQFEPHVN